MFLFAFSKFVHYNSCWHVVVVMREMLPHSVMQVAAYGMWASPKKRSAFQDWITLSPQSTRVRLDRDRDDLVSQVSVRVFGPPPVDTRVQLHSHLHRPTALKFDSTELNKAGVKAPSIKILSHCKSCIFLISLREPVQRDQ